jgi:tetratricopeptide (TPR) repeat protein
VSDIRPYSDPENWLAALSSDAGQDYLREHPDLACRETILKITERVPALVLHDSARASRLVRVAVWLAEQLNDDFCRARSARVAGHVFAHEGHYQDAVERYTYAATVFHASGESTEAAITLSSSLQSLMYLGRYDQAFSNAEQARQIFKSLGDKLRLARLDVNLGNVLNRQDRFEEALALYRRAEPILQLFGDYSDLAIVVMNIAVCSIGLFDFSNAVGAYERARELCNTHEMPLLAAQADYNIAYLYYLRGEFVRSIELYGASRVFSQRVGDRYHEALCDLDEAEIYIDLGLGDNAEKLASRAFASFQDLGLGYEAAKALAFVAFAAIQKGGFSRGLELLEAAQDRFIEQQNSAWPPLLDLYRGLCYLREGRLFESRRSVDLALTFFSPSRMPGKLVIAQLLRATLHLKVGEAMEARYWVDKAKYTTEKSGSSSLRYLCEYVLGTIQEATGAVLDAHASYQRSRESLETLPSVHAPDELKIKFLGSKAEVYEAVLFTGVSSYEDLTAPGRDESIFDLVQKAKSYSLTDTVIINETTAPPKEVHSAIAQRVIDLRQQMDWLHKRISVEELRADGADKKLEHLQQKAHQHESLLISSIDELKASGEERGIREANATVHLKRFLDVLPSTATFLEYFQVREVLHLCLISRGGVHLIPLTPTSRAKRLVQLLGEEFACYCRENEPRAEWSPREVPLQMLKDIYTELVAPAREFLHTAQIIAAPHDALHYLPFHALHDGSRYLIDDFSVSYAISATIYSLADRTPVPDQSRSMIVNLASSNCLSNQAEASRIAAYLPDPEIILGEEGTLEALITRAKGCKVMHIICSPSEVQPLVAGNEAGRQLLTLADLARGAWNCDLMTLGNPDRNLHSVDDSIGSARVACALIHAGARNVLMGLWIVPDAARVELLCEFYQFLAANNSEATCLRLAMVKLREKYSHPFYWATFVLTGRSG